MNRPRSAALARSAALLAAATTVGNLLGYGLVLILTRTLPPAEFGAASALLNLAVIGTVPAFAVQLVVARAVAAEGGHPNGARLRSELRRPALRIAVEVSGLLGLAVLVAAPALTTFLHLGGPWQPALVGAWLVPATVVLAVQGLLQGAERFLALSAVLVAVAAVRPVAGAVIAVTGSGVTALMALLAGGTALVALAAARLVGSGYPSRDPRTSAGATRTSLRREVAAATVATAGLLTLANVDLLLARNVLSAEDSGTYAVGALFAKGAFWAPQFISTLLYPRMAQGDRRSRAVVGSIASTVAAGALAVGVTVALARPLVAVVAGAGYQDLAPRLWIFACLGSLLAVAQVLLYARVAVGDRRLAVVSWLAIGMLTAAVLLDPAPDVFGVALRTLAAVTVVVVAGLGIERAAFGSVQRRADAPTVGDPAP